MALKKLTSLSALLVVGVCVTSCSTNSSLSGKLSDSIFSTKISKSKNSTSEFTEAELVKMATGGRSLTSMGSRLRTVRTTAYSDAENEKGGIYGDRSAAGTKLMFGRVRSAAADWSRYPLGTKFKIIGLPYTYVIDDYGSALVGTDTIDLYKPNLSMMNQWGTRNVKIRVLEWGSYQHSLSLLKGRCHHAHCLKMATHIQKKTRAMGMASSDDRRWSNES